MLHLYKWVLEEKDEGKDNRKQVPMTEAKMQVVQSTRWLTAYVQGDLHLIKEIPEGD